MKKILIPILALVLLLPLVGTAQKKPTNNVDLKVSFRDASGDKIISDGGGHYVDGVDGVAAKFWVDTTPNNFGLILNQTKTSDPRYALYDFSDQIYPGDGLYTAPWTSYPQPFRSRFQVLHVYSLTADSSPGSSWVCPAGEICGSDLDGTNYMLAPGDTGQLANGRDNYVLRFHEGGAYDAVINHPSPTVYFKIYHYLANLSSPEKWVITPDTGSIGGLTLTTGPNRTHNAGQYIMPFEMTLTRK